MALRRRVGTRKFNNGDIYSVSRLSKVRSELFRSLREADFPKLCTSCKRETLYMSFTIEKHLAKKNDIRCQEMAMLSEKKLILLLFVREISV
jgi:TPP-dependent indolepyruvate ferredoxin oxidoreductase alpha subunit